MRPGKSYIPCLRWKQGEYLALTRLSPATRAQIMPLIEVAEIGFDFETGKDSKSVDEHLKIFAKRVKEKWGTAECFVDLHLIGTTERMIDGHHPITFIFDDLCSKGVRAISVIGLAQDFYCRSAVSKIVKLDGRGLCLRVSLEEATLPKFVEKLKGLMEEIDIGLEQCDLILDLGAPPNFEPLNGFISLLVTTIRKLPHLNSWRSFGLIGTSFPRSLSGVKSGISFIPRNEWRLYKQLIQHLKMLGVRIPTFGDYVINHPEISSIDMRFMKPKANVRYTINDSWLIARGENVKDHGYGQHRELCKLVTKSKDYCGDSFSIADKYIHDCAFGTVPTGNLTTWRWIGTNHHLEMVVRDLANLDAS